MCADDAGIGRLGELPPEYAALLGLIDAMAAHHSLDALLEGLTHALERCFPFDALALTLHDPASPGLMQLSLLKPETLPRPPRSAFTIDEGPAGWVWQSQRTRVIRPGVDPESSEGLDFARSLGMRVTCWLPMTTARRRYGVLIV